MTLRLLLLLGPVLLLGACGDDANGRPPSGSPTGLPRASDAAGRAGDPVAAEVTFPSTTAHQVGVQIGESLTTSDVDEGCGDCHPEVVAAYARSGMHGALTLPTGEGSPEARLAGVHVPDEKTGIRVRFDVADGRYVQTLLYVDPGGAERLRYHMPVDLVIGSGASGRGYLGVAGTGLYVLPLSWYRELDAFALSPGPGFQGVATRAATTLCIQCHTGDAQPVDPRAQFGFTGDLSLGVGCSRCHGDGEEHSQTGDPRDIVNPSRLPIERQSELCYQCHFSGADQFFVPGRSLADHRPERPLSETMGVFVAAEGSADSGAALASHVVRLHRSRCFTESAGMTCTTCHNAHRPAGTDPEGCGVCHASGDDASDGGEGSAAACAESHGARGDRSCASCHMALVDSSDIQHTKTTDHWIRRRPEPPAFAGMAPEETRIGAHALRDRELVDVLDPDGEQPHAKLLRAHAYLYGVEAANTSYGRPAPAYLARAEGLLDELLRESPDDVEVLWRRAKAHRLAGRAGEAVELLERALATDPEHPSVVTERGLTALASGNLAGAQRWLSQALRMVPDELSVVHGLSQTFEQQNMPRDAVAALLVARQRAGPRVDLANIGIRLALRHGLLADALAFAWDRLAFRPRDALALAEAAEILRALGRGAEARPLYESALHFDPREVTAILGLAELERAAGKTERWRELRQAARRIAPDHPTFR